MTKRKSFGAIVRMVGGHEIYQCKHRRTADRIREACRLYNGWTGASTMQKLVNLIIKQTRRPVKDLVKEFSDKGNA